MAELADFLLALLSVGAMVRLTLFNSPDVELEEEEAVDCCDSGLGGSVAADPATGGNLWWSSS